MAYNNYFPVGYQPYQSYQYPQTQQFQTAPSQQTQPVQQQIQNSGYMTVRSEDEARNYPVAPGNSVTFFNETQPYCYKKTMGFSPLDRPTFEKYKIVKEDAEEEVKAPTMADDSIKAELEDLRAEVEKLKNKVRKFMKGKNDESKQSDANVLSITK